eukprot:403330799
MKKWEENRRQQLYQSKITQAKPTLSNLKSNYVFIMIIRHLTQEIWTTLAKHESGVALAVSEEIYSDHMGEIKISDLPIFQLLKAFKLQQYALKLAELGYGEDIYKLALFNDKQRQDLVSQLKVLPGHTAKLVSLFDVIDDLYPKKALAEQLKQFTPGGSHPSMPTDKKPKRITSAYKPRGTLGSGLHQSTTKSLLQQYENLDPVTKQAFNETFLANLESAKYNIGQLMSQHVNKEESRNAINYIFPPVQYLGYGGAGKIESAKYDDNYNREIDQLLKKYTQNTQYKGFNNQDALDKRVGSGQDLRHGMAQAMKDIEQINKHLEQFIKLPQSAKNHYQQAQKQQQEMIQQQQQIQLQKQRTQGSSSQMKTHSQKLQPLTKQSLNSSQQIKQQQQHPHTTTNKTTQQQVKKSVTGSSSGLVSGGGVIQQQRPVSNQTSKTTVTQKYEVFNDDQDKSRISIKNDQYDDQNEDDIEEGIYDKYVDDNDVSDINLLQDKSAQSRLGRGGSQQMSQDQDDEMPTETDISISESQIDEALNILNDPLALSLAVKEQYNLAVKQNKEQQEQQQKVPPLVLNQQEDASFINPLHGGDDSKLNLTQKYYQKQQVYDEPSSDTQRKRPMSPLIDRDERDRLWNCGQSLNSKQVTSALGYLDLKQICYCLANALMRHIDFSQGFYFLDDLQEHLRANVSTDEQLGERNQNFDFTYNIQEELKIDVEKAKQKKIEKEMQQKKEFEALKQKMQQTEGNVSQTPKQQQIKTQVIEYQEKKPMGQLQKQNTVQASLNKDLRGNDNDDDIVDESHNDEEQDINDEVEESDYIQDYYEDISNDADNKNSKKQNQNNNGDPQHPSLNDQDQYFDNLEGMEGNGDEDIDFDYSQTHLEDFLKSHMGQNTKNSNIQSSQLLNTFLSSYSKMKSGVGASFRDSHQLQNMLTSKNNFGAGGSKMNPIDEKLEDSEHSETRTKRLEPSDSEEEDGFGRSQEHIDLAQVEVKSSKSPNKQQKPILSQREVDDIKKKQQKEEEAKNKKSNEIKIDVKTKQGFKDLMRFQMRIFDQNYDFERDQLVGGETVYMGNPTIEEIYYYCKYVIISGRMEKEIPILCLNYIERFLTKTGVLMNHANWKRLTLISLTLASKIWDDDSLENVHFPQVMPDVTLKEIASIEKIFLQMIEFQLIIKGAEYAKYYFILKHFAEKFNSTLPMGPLSVEQMSDLQNNTVKAESDLRERYNVKLSLKKTM